MKITMLESLITEHVSYVEDDILDPKEVTKEIYIAINKKFPTNHSYRRLVEVLVYAYFNRTIKLIALGQIPSAYVDMHAVVEETALAYFPKNMKQKENIPLLRKLINRKTLNDIAPYYLDLNLWDKSDVSFAKNYQTLETA